MKNSKILDFIKNIGYVVTSNLLNLFVSSIVILVLPKMIGVTEYGFWQLYVFYSTYIGLFHFGWCDGIYLKYGGEEYDSLNRKYFKGQFVLLLAFQSILALSVILYSYFFSTDPNRLFVNFWISISFVIVNVRLFFVYILQATNRIKESSVVLFVDRLCFIFLVLISILLNNVSFELMITFDVFARFVSLIYAIFICRDIVLKRIGISDLNLLYVWDNIKIGINLMLANIASSLIIGTIRYSIQKCWSIATFGKISLTLSISNLVMVFINAIGVVLFPILKKTEQNQLHSRYLMIRSILMCSIFLSLFAYFPLQQILMNWLPKYRQSLTYMVYVFPMIVFESKTSLLLNTYLKALRRERIIFKVNVTTTIFSVIVSIFTAWIMHNLTLSVLSIIFLLAFRSTYLEYYLIKIIDIKVKKEIILEFLIVSIFIICNVIFKWQIAICAYICIYIIYIYFHKNELKRIKNI